ncbi:MAG: phosphate transport system permease protein [Actinomycetia bacterium]|nr:phosphate transport system permease protein [Actinomycetes bacterium]
MTATAAPPVAPRPVPVRRRPGGLTVEDVRATVLTLALALVVTAAAFLLTPLSGPFGFVVVAYALFLVLVTIDSRRRLGGVIAADRVASVIVGSCGALALAALALILWYVIDRGVPGLHRGFFTKTLESVGPLDPATDGGASHAIVGTLEQVGLAALISTPLGILTAVYLSELRGKAAPFIRFFVDSMSGIPSIVAGLFIYTVWVVQLDKGFSGLAAAMALAVLMLPTVARTAEEMLILVPGGLRESALALGSPHWRSVTRIVLPTALSGLITAAILGVARVAGETAPLLMTAFGNDAMNANPTKGAQSSLSLFAFQRVRNALPSEIERGWAAALVLIGLVLILFTLARLVATTRKAH